MGMITAALRVPFWVLKKIAEAAGRDPATNADELDTLLELAKGVLKVVTS